jgi:hypothetical protein
VNGSREATPRRLDISHYGFTFERRAGDEFADTVLLVNASSRWLIIPPPRSAEFPDTVLLVSIAVPDPIDGEVALAVEYDVLIDDDVRVCHHGGRAAAVERVRSATFGDGIADAVFGACADVALAGSATAAACTHRLATPDRQQGAQRDHGGAKPGGSAPARTTRAELATETMTDMARA